MSISLCWSVYLAISLYVYLPLQLCLFSCQSVFLSTPLCSSVYQAISLSVRQRHWCHSGRLQAASVCRQLKTAITIESFLIPVMAENSVPAGSKRILLDNGQSVRLSVCLSVCLSIYLSMYLSIIYHLSSIYTLLYMTK